MKITVAVDYGIRALIYLARQEPGKVCLISEISREQDIPEKFLSKIMQSLSKGNLVKSYRGVKGGFALARPADEVTLKDAFECLEGPLNINKCVITPEACGKSEDCTVRPVWVKVQERMLEALGDTRLSTLLDN